MRIKRLEIRKFRSLKRVVLDDLGDLVVIIGKNGSGKTGVIEALRYFFHEFDAGLERHFALPDNRVWYCEDTDTPVQFGLTLDMSNDEQEALAPSTLLEMWRSGSNAQTLTLTRHIAMTPGGPVWRTMEVKLGQQYLIRDGKPTPKAQRLKINHVAPELPPVPTTEPEQVQPEQPEEPSPAPPAEGEQVQPEQPEEPSPAPPAEGEQVQPEQPEEPSVSQNPPQLSDDANHFLENLSRHFRETLSIIPAVRSTPTSASTSLGTREPFINPEMQENLVKLHDSGDPADVAMIDEVQRRLEDILPRRWRLDFVEGRLYLFEANLRHPIALTGGGHQEYLAFVQRLLEEDRIFAIEEPESHLHAALCKQLFRLMCAIAEERQIILVTHSEHFLHLAEPGANWIFRKNGKQTKAARAKSPEELRTALDIIGGEPADRLFPNKLLLVAGETEEAVVPIWLSTLGIETGLRGVEVSAFLGESDWRKAAARIEAYGGTQTRLFVMVDEHGAHLIEKAERVGLPKDDCLVLSGTIEDCYPIDKLTDAMQFLFGMKQMDGLNLNPELPRVAEIQRNLKERLGVLKRNTTWKRGLGREVAKRMSSDEIPNEVREFLTRLAS